MNHSDIQNLASQHGSPFYLIDRARFEANFDALASAFQLRYRPFILAYSYKTNYTPYLCRIARGKGGWAETVSRMEYELALKIGCEPARIIFNGPVKHPEDIALALSGGSIVNLDCLAQTDAAMAYAAAHPDKIVPVGLRVNIGLSFESGVSQIQNGLRVGRFGFDPADLGGVRDRLAAAGNIRVVSLHGHTSTTVRSVWCFTTITETLVRLAETLFADTVRYLNIGGGFFGVILPEHRWCEVPSFEDYAEAVCGVLKRNPWVCRAAPTLVIEPGVSIAADAVSFFTRVVSVKKIKDKQFVTVDGSAFNTKPTFHKLNAPFQVVAASGAAVRREVFDVVGSTCMEKDILLNDVKGPLPSVGDFLRLDNVGAYTLVMTPPFIHPAPAILAQEGDKILCIRRRQTLDDIFAGYMF